jgi:hypothetical protein|tara:strand:- start:83 stop:319 length:237 start_codon:yes stop_codon:yes gene_type:complete
MIFWHLLVLTYTVEEHTFEAMIAFRDQPSCAAAMDKIYPVIYSEYRDSMAQCIKTEEASGYTVRPKPRPKGLKNELNS